MPRVRRSTPEFAARRAGPRRRGHARLLVLAALACAGIACAFLLASTNRLAAWYAHPARIVDGVPPETTLEGAQLVRVVAPILALVWSGLLVGVVLRGRRAAPVPARTLHRRSLMGVLALVAIALLARWLRAGESLWYDEIAAFVYYGRHGTGVSIGNLFTPANHVLQSVLSWFAATTWDSLDERVLRLPTIVIGALGVPPAWWLGRRAAGSTGSAPRALGGFTAASVAALAPLAVLAGAEARGYALMQTSALASTALALLALERRRPGFWLAYAVVAALGVWAHLVTAIVPVGHAIVVAWLAVGAGSPRTRGAARLGLGAIALAGLTTVALLAPALPDLLAMRGEFRASDGDEPTLLGPEGWHALLQFGGSWSPIFTIPGALLATLGVVVGLGRARARLPLLLAVAPVVALPIATTLGQSWMYARFASFTIATTAIATSIGVVAIARRVPARGTLAAGVALAVCVAAWVADLATRPPKQPVREAMRHAHDGAAPDTPILVLGIPDSGMVVGWYAFGQDRGLLDASIPGAAGDDAFRAALADARVTRAIVLYPPLLSDERRDGLRAAGFTEERRFAGWVDWTRGDVTVWRRDADRAPGKTANDRTDPR